jgi:hypothetical protein
MQLLNMTQRLLLKVVQLLNLRRGCNSCSSVIIRIAFAVVVAVVLMRELL